MNSGHLLMPQHDDDGICGTEVIERWAKDLRAKEREASAFAAELLFVAPREPTCGCGRRVMTVVRSD